MKIEHGCLSDVSDSDIRNGVFEVPEGVTSIGNEAFMSCRSLTEIILPNSATSIGDGAFMSCISLIKMTLPNSVTSIGDGAFLDCTSLTEMTLSDSVTSIGDGAFKGCISLIKMTLPNSVTSIGDGAFLGCTSLTEMTLSGSVTSIGDGAFLGCTSLTEMTLSGSVTSIGDGAFLGCTNLTEMTLSDSVTSIGDGAFKGCISLIEMTLPDSLTSIGDYAFLGCPLTRINIIAKTPEEFTRIKPLLDPSLQSKAIDVLSDLQSHFDKLKLTLKSQEVLDNEQAWEEQVHSSLETVQATIDCYTPRLKTYQDELDNLMIGFCIEQNNLEGAIGYFKGRPKVANNTAFQLMSAMISEENNKEQHQTLIALFKDYDSDQDIRQLLTLSALSLLTEKRATLGQSIRESGIERCLPLAAIKTSLQDILGTMDEAVKEPMGTIIHCLEQLTPEQLQGLLNSPLLKQRVETIYGSTHIRTYESLIPLQQGELNQHQMKELELALNTLIYTENNNRIDYKALPSLSLFPMQKKPGVEDDAMSPVLSKIL
nr:leucine-rich repeat domain-containing protein [uncultured Legionella sp.]